MLVAVQGRVASAAQQAGALSTQVLDQQQRLTEQEQQLAQSAAQARADSQTLAAERQRAAHQAETLQSSLTAAERRAQEADASLAALQRRLEEVAAEQQVGCRCTMSLALHGHAWGLFAKQQIGARKGVHRNILSLSWQVGWACNIICHASGSPGVAEVESTLGVVAGMVLPRGQCQPRM